VSNTGPVAGVQNMRPKAKGRLHQPGAGATISSLPMPLAPGTRLGSYDVVAPLGAGGMGEVYRARDAKLGREVALKILPTQFASDAERLARFEREARALAALNHPRIAAIYGLEEFKGQQVLVMELALGTSLADRLARGPLPVRDALGIGRPRVVAEGNFAGGDPFGRMWDLSADGQRFLMWTGIDTTTAPPIPYYNVVLNWFEELKQKMGAK
jgi:hypothetical protein